MKKSLILEAYLKDLNMQNNKVICEGAMDKITEYFSCFDKVNDISSSIANGQLSNTDDVESNGKDAINAITDKISILKKPTSMISDLGKDKIAPFFQKPFNTIKNGGNLKKSVKELMSNTKNSFNDGTQEALHSVSQISQSKLQDINKEFNIILQSRTAKRHMKKYTLQMQNAFKYFIKQQVKAHYYQNITKPIIIETSNSIITIKKNIKNNLVYEQKFNNIVKPVIIFEDAAVSDISASDMINNLLNKLTDSTYGLSKDQYNKFQTDSGLADGTMSQLFTKTKNGFIFNKSQKGLAYKALNAHKQRYN